MVWTNIQRDEGNLYTKEVEIVVDGEQQITRESFTDDYELLEESINTAWRKQIQVVTKIIRGQSLKVKKTKYQFTI